jgi:hypothetical protein
LGRSPDDIWLTIGSSITLFGIPQSKAPQEAPVTNYTAPKFHYLAGAQTLDTGLSRSEPSAGDTAARLTPGAAVVVLLLLSLVLWVAIWLALSFLAEAWFG